MPSYILVLCFQLVIIGLIRHHGFLALNVGIMPVTTVRYSVMQCCFELTAVKVFSCSL